MVIRGELKDKHFVHINEICFGQVFMDKKNKIFMKVQADTIYELEGSPDCFAVDLKYGDIVSISKDSNLRLLNCSLDVHGFVVN